MWCVSLISNFCYKLCSLGTRPGYNLLRIKTFISRPGYIAGLTPETKSTMKMRDQARTELKQSKGAKWILLTKYKKLRNKELFSFKKVIT